MYIQWNIIPNRHTMECYSALKSNVLIHAATWINLEEITLGEIKPDTKGQILYNSMYMRYSE